MTGTKSSDLISTKQREIAALAGDEPGRVLTTIAHRIDLVWMREAYRRTRKDGAAGVDAVDRKTFEANLDDNLASLLAGLQSCRYRAPPVRRVHIEKDGGKATRPIGIPTVHANCPRAQRQFGMGHDHSPLPSAERAALQRPQAPPCLGRADADRSSSRSRNGRGGSGVDRLGGAFVTRHRARDDPGDRCPG